MILLHHSRVPLKTEGLFSKVQSSDIGKFNKPRGLWVSVQGDDDWQSWCRSESFSIGNLTHHVKLAESANILIIDTAEGLDEFTQRYGTERPWGDGWVDHGINWKQVAEDIQGIIIAPYQWSRRMTDHTGWYYGWDCASGCIWDHRAIASVRYVEELSIPSEADRQMELSA